MNYTTIILNNYDNIKDAYKIYYAIDYYDELILNSQIILNECNNLNIDLNEFDNDKFINTLIELEYSNNHIIDLMVQIVYNDELKEQINHTDYYNDLYNECITTNYDIELIGQYLIDLAQINYSNPIINSDLINNILKNNIEFELLDDNELKYYNAIAYKLESYDIFIDKYNYLNDESEIFNKVYAACYDLEDYNYDKISNAIAYNYIDLQYYLDELYNIDESISFYVDYEKIIYDLEINGQITPLNTDKAYYDNNDLFLYEVF